MTIVIIQRTHSNDAASEATESSIVERFRKEEEEKGMKLLNHIGVAPSNLKAHPFLHMYDHVA